MLSPERTDSAFDASYRKRLLSGVVDKLGPEDSLATFMARRAGPGGLRTLFNSLSDQEVAAIVYDLDFWARQQQIPPNTPWENCVALGGRGFGKTWMGARWVIRKASEGKDNGALIGATAADTRDTMVKGSSGILALSPPWFMPEYTPSNRRLTWPNGVYAICYSADKPDRLRGPNTGWVWGDEPCSWRFDMAALDQVTLFNRIGTKERPPQALYTGTPRPLKKLEELLAKPGTIMITGSSLANSANLAPSTVRNMRAMAKTRWGRQEVMGELLLDVPGAIFGGAKWVHVDADAHTYGATLERRVVAVDPAPTSETGADESGIIVEGVRTINGLKHISILKDASVRASPKEWASAAIHEYQAFACEAIVVEVNTGGELVEQLIKTVAEEMGVQVNVRPVRAREAKSKRAEPVSALAEAGRIEFIGSHPKLENQLSKFTGIAGRRDDRADAFCWGVHDLAFGEEFWFV